jgi:predicted dehydrogenase/GNAT superfamily N-acetyltransferase
MGKSKDFKVGLVGAAGRGGTFRSALKANGARIHAVCDVREDKLDECARRFAAPEQYVDYEEMLARSDLDAVVIGTPMPLHVPQSIAALQRGLHVLCEVPAGVSVEECRRLVEAAEASDATYMMAENYVYARSCVLVRELCRQGLFGEPYYAEGEYLHELKQMNEDTPWRRTWQTGIAGITYGTHSIGPILQWMDGDRVVKVCCANSGSHYTDPRGEPYAQDTATMLCKTARGALIVIRVDMVSDRPHAMHNHHLQGTDGVYESSRGGPVDRGKIWLRALSEEIRWHDLEGLWAVDALAERYMPEMWRRPPEQALRAGHGGGDFFEVWDFMRAVRGEAPCPIGVHQAMDMTLPGLLSQQSVLAGGAWLDVPDSRAWREAPPPQQLQMVWPEQRLDAPPKAGAPKGYELRCFDDSEADRAGWLEVMGKAGFEGWDGAGLARTLRTVLPGGLFVAVHRRSGSIVATAMAQHVPDERHPYGGVVGWVAGDPAHRGRGLGLAVVAAATARLLRAGYTDIYLRTDDWRLAAIKTYLKCGYEPLLFCDGMAERWAAVRKQLNG